MADFGLGAPVVLPPQPGPEAVAATSGPVIVLPLPGPAGDGVPAGGSTGQVLGKASDADQDTEWVNQSGGGGAVDSVFGRTGVVVADPADYATDYDPLGAADTAQADAQDYADTAINTAIGAEIIRANAAYDPAGVAAGVLVTAEAYADTKVAAEVTRANGAYDALGAAATAQAAAIAASQPLDADLTAIAALTTTTFGRALLTQSDAAALRTAAGLGTAATHPATDFDSSGAAAAAQAASQPLDSDLTAIAALITTSFGRSFLALADAAAGRTLLGLGTLATQSGTFSGTSSGTNTGDQTLPTTLPPNGAAGGVLTGTYPNPSGLAATTVTAAAYGSATSVPMFTVGADGRLTAAGTVSIAIPESAVTNLVSDLALKAPLASATLTGSPTAPTAAALDNTTRVATTAYADTADAVEKARALAAEALLAPLASPALTGTPTVPTAAGGTNTTQAASTAFVTTAVASAGTTAVNGIYGDGSDGNVSVSTTVTLTRDMFYDTLTVTGTGTLKPSSFRVFCKTACVVQASGVIQTNGGSSATTGAGGSGGGAGTIGQGKAGAVGGTGAGTATTTVTNGLGGIGGNGGAGTPNAGGTAVAPTAIAATNGDLRTLPQAAIGLAIGTATAQAGGGTGGASGGGDGTNSGGGGGGSGGVLIINAKTISNSGTISSNGGGGGSPTVGNVGGGGGGGGGLVIINTGAALVGNTPTATGGTGGTKFGTGINGSNGAAGSVRVNVWS